MDKRQSKVERFLKLGYSYGDILRVLESLRHDAQTNDILEELIKTGRKADSSPPSSPQLVPRGCNPPQPHQEDTGSSGGLRPIVIDGSNVAMSHGNKQVFSCRGVQLAVKWFWDRGHRDITVFVPLWRKAISRPDAPIMDQHILYELEQRKILVFTPSRCINGKRVVCYDDRYIVKLAFDSDGIIVSNDNYRDLQIEKPQWKKFIEERLLMYTFANDKFMPPDDPLGRNGPTLDNLLRKTPTIPDSKRLPCPYGKKCTYGIKCKYYHPERSNQSQLSVADELRAKTKPSLEQPSTTRPSSPGQVALLHDHGHSGHFYSSLAATKVPAGQENLPCRLSPCKQLDSPRKIGSPVHSCKFQTCQSLDSDEAFGSVEESMAQLYIHESVERQDLSQPYSRGPVSSPQNQRRITCCCCLQTQRGDACSLECHYYGSMQQQQDSYDELANNHNTFEHYLYPGSSHRHSTLAKPSRFPELCYAHPHTPWGGAWEPTTRAPEPISEQRRSMRTQLGSIFPPSTVDQAMRLYPHTLNVSELVPLIHRLRTSHVHF